MAETRRRASRLRNANDRVARGCYVAQLRSIAKKGHDCIGGQRIRMHARHARRGTEQNSEQYHKSYSPCFRLYSLRAVTSGISIRQFHHYTSIMGDSLGSIWRFKLNKPYVVWKNTSRRDYLILASSQYFFSTLIPYYTKSTLGFPPFSLPHEAFRLLGLWNANPK